MEAASLFTPTRKAEVASSSHSPARTAGTIGKRNRRAARILVIEDDETLNELLVEQLERQGHVVRGVSDGRTALAIVDEFEPSLVILDVRLPDMNGFDMLGELTERANVIVLTAYGSVKQAVAAVHAGASDYLMKPVNADSLNMAIARVVEQRELRRAADYWKSRVGSSNGPLIVGESEVIGEVERLISLVAPADTTVLIHGESGVGKELVAEAVHAQSTRADKPFVAIDCTTLQENLFESELFGHERGSFTGADRKKEGLVEVAEGGTVFLDEIGEITPALQAKLLRVLETGRFRRLGGTRDLEADVRFIAATNRDLQKMAGENEFRNDLYYRLSAFDIPVPPLRSRRDDIALLAEYFLQNRRFSRNIQKRFSKSALRALTNYRWPGNVRELRNVVERAFLVSADSPRIRPEHITLPEQPGDDDRIVTLSFDHEPTLDELRDCYILRLLERYGGNRHDLAERLGVSERNVYRHLSRLKEEC